MNKIFNVNLGGYPFTIDEDAYHAINKYLGAIQAHFADSEGCDEILDDIEARIAELFTEYLAGASIVTIKEYNSVVKVMGRPEDFGAEVDEDFDSATITDTPKSSKKGKYSHIKPGKRLFRDTEDKVIGGVCSGVSAYFGIADPLWVRLGFLVLIFIGGISVLLYPILWAIVPPAKTAGDKLKMKGEPATVSNIAKTVEEELTDLSNKISEMSKDLGKDLGSKKKIKSASFLSPKRAISGLISLLGKGVVGILSLLKTILKPIFSVSLGFVLLMLGILWAVWIISYISAFPFISYLGPSPGILSFFGGVSIFTTVGIPIVALMLLITKWFSSYRIPTKWRNNMRLGWVVSFVVSAIAIVGTAFSFNHEAENIQRASFSINDDVINISELVIPENEVKGIVQLPNLSFAQGGVINDNVHFSVELGDEEEVVIMTKVVSHGVNFNDAQNLATNVQSNYEVEGNEIRIPDNFKIKKGNKFRGQRIEYTIQVPEGKEIVFDESISRNMWNGGFKKGYQPSKYEDYKWKMTKDGMISEAWEKDYNATKTLTFKSLENLNIDGEIATTIIYGPKSEIVLSGYKEDLAKIEEITTGDATSIIVNKWLRSRVKATIVTPNLKKLHAKNLRSLKMEGFKQDQMEINYSDKHGRAVEMKAYIDVKKLVFNVGGSTEVTLIGSGEQLDVNILDGARIIAEKYKVKTVNLKGNIYNNSSFYASDSFNCPDNERRSITLYGNPELLAVNDTQH